jgi:hypothetical protein
MAQQALKSVRASQVAIFRIKNRRGYAAVCFKNLTEGKSAAEAFQRLRHPLRRMGYALPARMPVAR